MILKLQKDLAANVNTNPQDVFAAKAFLQDQGHYTAPEWGLSEFPDRALFDAIKAFQKSNGLRVDGVMNPEGETEAATQSIQAAALNLQSLGRNGDTILAHITPDEAKMLKANGGAGTLNPKTGLMEFYGTYANNRARDKAERDSSANRSDTSSSTNNNNGNSGKKESFSFLGSLKEDLGNLFSGNWTGPASAYDTRNADARAVENGGKREDYLRGGYYGPGGGGYSASALHAAGVRAQAKADRERTRQAQRAQNKESRADQYSALAKTDEDPNLDTKSTQARPNRSASLYGPPEAGQREIVGPHQAASAPQSSPTQAPKTAAAKQTATPGVDPSWVSSSDPSVQAQNVRNTNARRAQEQEDAKAKQRMDAEIANQRTKVATRAPDRTFTDAQLKGAAQAELSRKSASASIQAQASAAKAAGAKANAAKAAQTKQARAVINLLAPTVIKALTAKPVAPVAGAPISDAAIGDATQALKAAVKSIDPNKTFSFNELKEGSVNILSGNGKTSAVQDYLASNKAGQTLESWRSQPSMIGEGVQVADNVFVDGLNSAVKVGRELLDGTWAKRRAAQANEKERKQMARDRYLATHPLRNNLLAPQNNPNGVPASVKAGLDALEAKAATRGGQTLSLSGNAVKNPGLGNTMSILGTGLEQYGKKLETDFLNRNYSPKGKK